MATDNPQQGPLKWLADRSARIEQVSGALPAWLSTVPDQGTAVAGLLPGDPEIEQRLGQAVAAAASGASTSFEFGTADGSFRVTTEPRRDGKGAVVGVTGTLTTAGDLASCEPTEPTPADSEERYRLLVERSPYCIHQIDREGRLVAMNRAGLTMMGLDRESAIVGMSYLDCVCDQDRERVAALMSSAYESVTSQFEFQASNGHLFASSFIPIHDESGRVCRLMGLTQDVTGQRLAERARKDSEQRLELALHGARLGMWDWNVRSDELVVNRRWAELLGYDVSEIGTRPSDICGLIHPDERERVRQELYDHLAGRRESYGSEHRLRTRDGSWRWVLDWGMVVERDEDGRALRASGTTLDITERRELESRVQQAQRMDSIGQLAGGIAHDFNNLLLVILGHLDFAQDGLCQGEDIADNLEQIRRGAERAAELTKRLLAFSRRQPVELKVVDLNALTDSLARMIERVLPENIVLAFDLASKLPAVHVDPGQIEQALLNLCVNARDAMLEGGKLTIGTRVIHAGDERPVTVELSVTDTGYGMEREVAERAFDPYFTTKQRQGGTGLGLATVYGIMSRHGGSVRLDSRAGSGTRATLAFPAAAVPAPEIEAANERHELAGNETILVVEDEALVRRLVTRMLEDAGYSVLEARDGVEGAEVFAEHAQAVDLVLLDAIMPRGNGRETYEQIVDHRAEARVLFTSGYNLDNTLPQEFLDERQLDILQKPYGKEALLTKVRQVLDRQPGQS